MSHSTETSQPKRYDPFKDSLWRFLGYANEVGEALRPLVPVGVVYATYAIAIGYGAFTRTAFHLLATAIHEICKGLQACQKKLTLNLFMQPLAIRTTRRAMNMKYVFTLGK